MVVCTVQRSLLVIQWWSVLFRGAPWCYSGGLYCSEEHTGVTVAVHTVSEEPTHVTVVVLPVSEELRAMFHKAGLEEVQNLIDRRLQVNRGRQLKMYRVWIQCKYRRPL